MKIYTLHRQKTINMNMEQAWDFFSSPHNLNDITPDFFHLDITSPVPAEIYAGLMISYRMRAVGGFAMSWLSEVSQCQKPQRFVYQQHVGPFAFWSHEVCFTNKEEGVIIEDIVFYAMPWGWLGEILHPMLIGKKLKLIFDCRQEYLESNWGING